jgi:hypothetical protein
VAPVYDNPEDDPHFIPKGHPDFIPPPDEPFMDASGPTDRNAKDLGRVLDPLVGEVTDADCHADETDA